MKEKRVTFHLSGLIKLSVIAICLTAGACEHVCDDFVFGQDENNSSSDPGDAQRVSQPPLKIRVINDADATRYIWTALGPRCKYQKGNTWETCRFASGGDCMALCDDFNGGDDCCMSCEEDALMIPLESGATREFEWNGMLFEAVENHCSCACLMPARPPGGAYSAAITVYSEMACANHESCTIDENGVLWAYAKGERFDYETEFTVPFDGDILEIRISE